MRFLGKLTRMAIQHDNSSSSPDWHLFKAVVTCSKDGSSNTFMCNKWIASNVSDMRVWVRFCAKLCACAPMDGEFMCSGYFTSNMCGTAVRMQAVL